MAGLFGLFGGNKDQEPQSKDAFFLDGETAKSMGDTSYMKATKTIRRTFPKSAGSSGEFEVIQEVSALDKAVADSRKGSIKQVVSSAPTSAPAETPSASAASTTSQEAQERRKLDTSMDMFRNMAKDIRK